MLTRTIRVIRLATVFARPPVRPYGRANRYLLLIKHSIRGHHRDPVARFARTGQARRCSQQNMCKVTGNLLSINLVTRHS